ncbi:flavo protein [Gonapodya prolifera JEL478]|uniref:Flavo protein n=1 Tax=Gonapodya prolifera (strain JEL478) TaxID=1344416 RepID=A0A139AWD5_GONPJ|nr:flavo protein [Gonapodya prolifera JEL478]|eukprot:KXS21019.1 flavo protein [Gonapodya prolifera JEL478]
MPSSGPLRIVSVLGSIRPNRVGIHVAKYVNSIIEQRGHSLTFVDPAESQYDLPLLRRRFMDYKNGETVPENLQRLHEIFEAADVFVLIGPEYNTNVSPVLANLLDHFNNEYKRKAAAICSYSAGPAAGRLSGNNLRSMCAMLEMITVPMSLSWGAVGQSTFGADGVPHDAGMVGRTQKFIGEVEFYGQLMKTAREASS